MARIDYFDLSIARIGGIQDDRLRHASGAEPDVIATDAMQKGSTDEPVSNQSMKRLRRKHTVLVSLIEEAAEGQSKPAGYGLRHETLSPTGDAGAIDFRRCARRSPRLSPFPWCLRWREMAPGSPTFWLRAESFSLLGASAVLPATPPRPALSIRTPQ